MAFGEMLGMGEQPPAPIVTPQGLPQQGMQAPMDLGEGPPKDEADFQRRKVGWAQTLQTMMNSPQGQLALFTMGAKLLGGPRAGQTNANLLAEGAMAGAGAVAADKAQKRKEFTEDRGFQLEAQKTGAYVETAGAQADASRAAAGASRFNQQRGERLLPIEEKAATAKASTAETEAQFAPARARADLRRDEAEAAYKDRMPKENDPTGPGASAAMQFFGARTRYHLQRMAIEGGVDPANLTPKQRLQAENLAWEESQTQKRDDDIKTISEQIRIANEVGVPQARILGLYDELNALVRARAASRATPDPSNPAPTLASAGRMVSPAPVTVNGQQVHIIYENGQPVASMTPAEFKKLQGDKAMQQLANNPQVGNIPGPNSNTPARPNQQNAK